MNLPPGEEKNRRWSLAQQGGAGPAARLGGSDRGIDPRVVVCLPQQILDSEMGSPFLQISKIEMLPLHLQHAQNVAPLAVGDPIADLVPMELLEDDVLGRRH